MPQSAAKTSTPTPFSRNLAGQTMSAPNEVLGSGPSGPEAPPSSGTTKRGLGSAETPGIDTIPSTDVSSESPEPSADAPPAPSKSKLSPAERAHIAERTAEI